MRNLFFISLSACSETAYGHPIGSLDACIAEQAKGVQNPDYPRAIGNACAEIFKEPACSKAFRGFHHQPPERRAVTLVRVCADAYCPKWPSTTAPRACIDTDILPSELLPAWQELLQSILYQDYGVKLPIDSWLPLPPINIPIDASYKPSISQSQIPTVSLEMNNASVILLWNGKPIPNGMDWKDFVKAEKGEYQAETVIIQSQSNVPFQDVRMAIEALHEAGLTNIQFQVK